MLRPYSLDGAAAARRGAAAPVVEAVEGLAGLETFTVLFHGDGSIDRGVAVLRLPDGARTLAAVPSGDATTLGLLMGGERTAIGHEGRLEPGDGAGLARWVACGSTPEDGAEHNRLALAVRAVHRAGMAELLRIDGLEKSFGGVRAVDGCSFGFAAGAVTGLIGPNGAGKTTLLDLVCGLVRPERGRVELDGRDVTGWAPHLLAAAGLVRTFQIVRAFASLTVLENLMVAAPAQIGERLGGALLARRRVRDMERETARSARALLERVGLWRLADAPAGTLSGGQRKLLELARALMLRPRMIMLDEPAAGVAPPLLGDIIGLVRDVRDEGVGFVLVEHDMGLIGALCDQVHVMAEGRPLVSGSFAAVTADPRVRDAYLGIAA